MVSFTSRSSAQRLFDSGAAVVAILLIFVATQHVSPVQGFASSTQPGRSAALTPHPAASRYYYGHGGYSTLRTQRHLTIPFRRNHSRTSNNNNNNPKEVQNNRPSRISRLKNRLSRRLTAPFQKSGRNHSSGHQTPSTTTKYRSFWVAFASLAFTLVARPTTALAMGAMGGASKGPVAPISRKDALSLFGVFFGLFVALALLHAAEIAITTLYPWKVREFAEEVSTAKAHYIARTISFSLFLSINLISQTVSAAPNKRRRKVVKREPSKS